MAGERKMNFLRPEISKSLIDREKQTSPAKALKHTDPKDSALVAARNARNITVVRWYLMIYPFGRKGLQIGLDREIERRRNAGEPPIEYFAPVYVEAKDVDGRIVRTEKQLFHNYVFIRSSVKELFRMKKFEEQYNFPRRETNSNGEFFYPYVSDEMIRNLKWIARSYSGVIPIYTGDTSWLVKGDRIRITSGPFKGVEANLYNTRLNSRREIMVAIDNWMTVPLLHIKEGQYKVIALDGKSSENLFIDDELIPRLHEILCRHLAGEFLPEDESFAHDIVGRFTGKEAGSDVIRCKLYSILLMAYTILHEADRKANLLGIINIILPALTAEQSKALLLTTLYGCTDDSIYYRQAHALVDPWSRESSPKKSKQLLIRRLADYDRILKH